MFILHTHLIPSLRPPPSYYSLSLFWMFHILFLFFVLLLTIPFLLYFECLFCTPSWFLLFVSSSFLLFLFFFIFNVYFAHSNSVDFFLHRRQFLVLFLGLFCFSWFIFISAYRQTSFPVSPVLNLFISLSSYAGFSLFFMLIFR